LPHIAFDLATKIIEPSQTIWAVFPGVGRKFLRQFAEERVIFLDTPALELTPAALTDDGLLRQHIAMSAAWAKFYQRDESDPPSRRPADYKVARSNSFGAMVGNVRNVFDRMQPGDLVLTGAQSLYDSILVGEVVGKFDPKLTVQYRTYGREKIPARRVQWLPVRRERRFLSQGLSQLLSNRKAVISIDQKAYGEEIYKFAYGDYVLGSGSRYVFPGPRYNNIARSLSPGIDLISYFVAAFHAVEIGELDKFAKLSIEKGSADYFEADDLISFTVDFSSPGEYILQSKRAAQALLVALPVAATSSTTLPYNDARAAEVTNSAGSSRGNPTLVADPQLVVIQENFKSIMDAVGAAKYNQLCVINKECQDGVGLKTGVKIEKTK
jgi:hypothetical protein